MFVSELCLGTMTFGGNGQIWEVIGGLDQSAADAHRPPRARRGHQLHRHRERVLRRRVGDDGRQGAARATPRRRARHESARPHGPGRRTTSACRASHIVESVDASLKRLDTDYIDLYQIHRFDPLTNIEDTLRALDDLVRAGKVRYIGCSNLPAWQLMKALAVSREQHLERFRCTQSYYSLVGRELERETIPLLKDQGLGLLVWSPLAGGFLSGKFTRTGGDEAARRAKFDFPPVDKEKGFDILDVLVAIAKEHGVSVAQIALAWILANDAVTSVIIGARKLSQLDDNLKAIDVTLTAGEMKALDEVSKLTAAVSGVDGLRSAPIGGRASGGTEPVGVDGTGSERIPEG